MLLANHCGDRQSPGLTGGDVEGYSTGPNPAQFLYKLGHAGEADLCGRGKLQATKGDFAGPKIADALSERGSARLMVVGPNSHVMVGTSNTLLIGPGESTISWAFSKILAEACPALAASGKFGSSSSAFCRDSSARSKLTSGHMGHTQVILVHGVIRIFLSAFL